MNKALRKVYFAPLVLVMLMAACSSQPEPAANDNTATSSPVAQNGTVPASSDAASPAAATSGQPAVAPVEGARIETAPPTIAAAGQLVTGPTPKLVVPAAKIDFGKQPQSKSIARTITIRNAGKAALNIAAVEPSWGCTTVDFPKVLSPGKAGTIKVKVDTGTAPGEHSKSVTIKSNDPLQPSVKVEFSFTTNPK